MDLVTVLKRTVQSFTFLFNNYVIDIYKTLYMVALAQNIRIYTSIKIYTSINLYIIKVIHCGILNIQKRTPHIYIYVADMGQIRFIYILISYSYTEICSDTVAYLNT